ncbi:acyl-CoA dehydrogenase [Mycolicibacterium flavescens]|uniref:Acyl-CoA dehydrogenase n=1 Tax=Mycolicibacterium flavescens TaxID=1776 RepID=A0A1E3RES4_MYCFV|nr:acyl-CoA dehydrogenase family protein [Mycolicibacterium flavescens]MCV7282424.1 acyl-CoA dehydrogenase [Mycolicibacterium flavescens]ODQ87942.1 acyl-CoA dehydrogenase [Mycolicibacterium flavescens]
MDADTRDLLRGSLRAMFADDTTDLLAELAEMGWAEVVSDDEAAAVDLLFTEQGRAGAASAALDEVMLGSGPDTSVVVHPLAQARSTVDAGRLDVDGVVLHTPPDRPAVVLASGERAFVVENWSAEPVAGFAPRSRLHRVRLSLPLDDLQARDIDVPAAIAAARRALSAELIGNAGAMLDLAVGHVTDRVQFGRPIGTYQTPRHRLADAYAQVEAARELLGLAWRSRSAWDADVAKAYAGWAAETTAAACMQVCGAIGLSSEHALGGYVARSRVLDALYGGWQDAIHDIGERLLDGAAR